MDSLDKTKKKMIEELEKQRAKELEEAKEHYASDLQSLQGKDPKDIKEGRFRKRLKDPDKEAAQIQDLKEHVLVNVEAIKEFIKYGSNKVLDQIRVRSHANTIAREEISKLKKKNDFNVKQAAMTFLFIIVIAVMAYTMATQFLNVTDVQKELQQERSNHGVTMGKLAACTTELEQYKPKARATDTGVIPVQTTTPNTLQG